MKILTVDIGTGTQDIFLYDSLLDIEDGFKPVLPSPTMMVHRRLKRVTVPQLDIITCLGRTKGLPLSELAERLLVSGGNVTGIIDRLERDGYVYRARDEADRRVVRALLTEKGYERYNAFLPRYKEIVNIINNGLTGGERKELQRLLKKLARSVQASQKARG